MLIIIYLPTYLQTNPEIRIFVLKTYLLMDAPRPAYSYKQSCNNYEGIKEDFIHLKISILPQFIS